MNLSRYFRWLAAGLILCLYAFSSNALAVTPMVSVDGYFTVALKSDGTVLAWGNNDFGQLGDGTTTRRSSTVAVSGLTEVTAVSANRSSHTVALKSDGTVLAWGNNDSGQLGDGTTTRRSSPVAVSGLTGVMAVSAGYGHTVALKSDGTVLAWGDNSYGQLGDGTTTDRSSPAVVPGLTGVVAVSAGWFRTVALKSDGTVVAWGANNLGTLGDGTSTNRSSPVAVTGLTGVAAVATGKDHTVALKSDGTVLVWGSNSYGQLGNGGTTTRSFSPVAVPGLTGVVAVSSASSSHVMALKSDGTVMAWGQNIYGQLGDGTTTDRLSPMAVPGLTGVAAVSAGQYHTVALKSDGTLLAWGDNFYGQLGDGTMTDRLSPVVVFGLNLIVSQSDCIFNWAEQNFAQFFSPATTSVTYVPYYYRYYSDTGNFLAVSSADNHLWVLGPSFGNNLLDVGALTDFLSVSGCP